MERNGHPAPSHATQYILKFLCPIQKKKETAKIHGMTLENAVVLSYKTHKKMASCLVCQGIILIFYAKNTFTMCYL